jgi:hypothetical protein
MLTLALLRSPNIQPHRGGGSMAAVVVPSPGRPTSDSDTMILLEMLLRAQAAAYEYRLAAAAARHRGTEHVAALAAEAAAMEHQFAQRAAELARKLVHPGKKAPAGNAP